MGLTIATKDRRFCLKMDEEKCEALFNRIVSDILAADKPQDDCYLPEILLEPDVNEAVAVGDKASTSVPAMNEALKIQSPSEVHKKKIFDNLTPSGNESEEEILPGEKNSGYGGFLYLECPYCGKRRAFCSRYPLKYYKCDRCGEKTELHDLVQMFLNCECGKNTAYLTNVTDEIFDVECINCGAPVAVQYNAKKKIYETIRG